MSRSRLREAFASAGAEGRTAFLPFMTAGLPSPNESAEMFMAMEADAYEIGIPYSDPLMDGPTIQEAGRRALAAGTTFSDGLDVARQVVDGTGKPALVMTYANVVFQVGPERFAAGAAAAGVSGVIVADLPVEEAAELSSVLADHGLGLVLFVAPTTTDARLAAVVAADPVFIYGVAEVGVTGERQRTSTRAAEVSRRVREVTDAPLVLGVGISTPEQARDVAPLADGIIVGSALVRRVLDAPDARSAAESLRAASTDFMAALRK